MLVNLLTWLDASPAHYWIVAWITFCGFAAIALLALACGREKAWWQHPVLFSLAMLIVLLAFRWPELLDNRQYPDPDESQFIAGASTMREDPIFWRSVDGTTHGPLTEWPLLIALGARGSLDFATARTVSILLVWLELISALLIFRHLYKKSVAGLLVLPLLATHAFTQAWSFVAYGSEHVPDALIAIGCCALFTAWRPNGTGAPDRSRLFATGVLLGAISFAKLQAVPIAAAGVAAGAWLVLTANSVNWNKRVRDLGALVGGAVTMSIMILGIVLATGIWSDFFSCYILDNLQYAAANRFPSDRSFTLIDGPRMLLELGDSVGGFNQFTLWMAGFGGCGLLLLPRFTPWQRRCAVVAAALLVAAALAAIAPGRPYLHYLQLIIFPTGLLGGLVAGAVLSDRGGSSMQRWSHLRRAVIVVAFLSCGLGPQIWWRICEPQPFIGRFTATRGDLVRSEVSQEILQHAHRGETLGIWGWMPVFWVETGLIQASRDGQTSRQIEAHPRRDYYRARFLQDLVRSRPPVFVDAVGPENFVYEDRSRDGHETFALLDDYIEQNYHLVRELNGTRIYVRNDRL